MHVARTRNWTLLPRSYYSPVPDLRELRDEDWDRRSELYGLDFDLDAQLELCRTDLAGSLAEIAGLLARGPVGAFALENPSYSSVDAELLWAIIRSRRPDRVLEVGSGNSTLMIAAASDANRRDGHPLTHVVCDPHPRSGAAAAADELLATRAQDVPWERFAELQAGDVLFVDTTHTVRLAGEVNAIVLDVLPRLAPGVLVHFHDIWLPFEYHRVLLEMFGWYWNEQYLLQAFLAENPRYRVLLAAQALVREHPAEIRRLIPSYTGENYPTAFWIESRTAPAATR